MDSVRCSLSPKGFQGLLTALAKRNYYKENDYTDAIINQLYAGIELEPAEIVAEISMFEKLIRRAALENWDVSKLSEFAKGHGLDGDYIKVMVVFWNKESVKIHKSLVQGCTWNNSLENVKWRVDVKAVGKTAAEINEPIAMFELKTKKGFVNEDLNKSKTSGDVVMLTMNREAIGNIITQFDAIKKKFEELA